jgi:GTP pyrophosphokinase
LNSSRYRAENQKKMFLAMAEDIRVVLIKLADRLHNMRTLSYLKPERQASISRETLDFYAPLAHRLGMYRIKWQLEDLAFKIIDPDKYNELADKLDMKRGERVEYTGEVVRALKLFLENVGIKAKIDGRAKHIYSIHKKMVSQSLDFDQLTDLIAVRIVTEEINDCYSALGIIHSVYKPLFEKFKDYIGRPKPNGYQSIHTTVFGPREMPVEIQIRTQKMHEVAEYGIAAHWRYKEKRGAITDLDEKLKWLREALEVQDEDGDARAFIDNVKIDLFTDEVFIFTPKGDVITLPKGATPVDFAYRIHTEIGHRCRGARVNGRMVPLNTSLSNGQIVEIITTKKKVGPSRDWLNFVRSSYAASKIRHWFRKESEDEQIALGKDLLAKEEKRLGLSNIELVRPEVLRNELRHYGMKTLDGLYAAIGRGDLNPRQVVSRVRERLKSKLKREKSVSVVEEEDTHPPVEGDAKKLGVLVQGLDDVWVRFARCCRPIPGDKVVGFITKGRGITLHRSKCPQLNSPLLDKSRKVSVSWTQQAGATYATDIDVWCLDRVGILRDIAQITSSAGASVSGIQMHFTKDKTVRQTITVKVGNVTELNKIMRLLRGVDDVLEVKRSSS